LLELIGFIFVGAMLLFIGFVCTWRNGALFTKFLKWQTKALKRVYQGQAGEFGVGVIIYVVIGIVVVGTVVAALWGTLAGTDTSIQALTQTDAGTSTLQTMWPIVLVIIGIGIAAGAVMWALRKFNVMK